MNNLLKCKSYAFCLQKLRDIKITVKKPLDNITKLKINKVEEFYDDIIKDDEKIKSCHKIIAQIKKDTIKELVYANKEIPLKWKKTDGYNNFVIKLISKDDEFLSYLGHSPKNEIIKNRNIKNRPKTGFLSVYNNNISLRNSFFELNKPISSRNNNNLFKLVKDKQKFIRSKSLNNFDSSKKYSSFTKFKENILNINNQLQNNFIKKVEHIPLFSPNKTSINFFINRKQNLNRINPDTNNEINKKFINYNPDDILMKFQAIKFKQRLQNLKRNIYSNLVSSISKSSTKKSRNAIKYNSFNNNEFYKKKKISNKLIKKFLQRLNNQKNNNFLNISGNKNNIELYKSSD